jgi:hypothetical protein
LHLLAGERVWGRGEIVGAVSGSTKPIRNRAVQNPKLRYFKSFELFDHTPFQ